MFLLVSVRHVGAHRGEHQHGVSIQISISLGKTFLRISRVRNLPLTWILARVFVYVPPFISQILDFIYWTVLSFILIYFEWRDTENQQLIIVEYIKTHTVVLWAWFAVYSVRILAGRRHHGCFRAEVSIVGLRSICVIQYMFIRANAVDSHSLVMVAAKYFLSLRNVLCHRARSVDVSCNTFEIHNNL